MLKALFTCLSGAAMSLGLALPGWAEPEFWKKVGNWEISIDATIGNGCYAVASWTGGTVLRIGLNPEKDNFYMLIGNDAWTSLRAEEQYDVSIQFDSRNPWDVTANGLQFSDGGVVYLHAQSTKFDFLEEFMRGNRLKLSYGGKEIDVLKLNGSSRAFKEVIACQEVVDARPTEEEDPFATGNNSSTSSGGKKSTRTNDDPFAN